ncbi:hypothetical protein DBY21_07025 [Candidatus Gastranaerophilales bacterium]|nr:MAG: hypothetical protein DBY21_07025 [Candidatus Gastranaerophilales bacterium]
MKVLVTDNVNAVAEEILKNAGIEAVVMKTQQPENLCEIIKDFDGIIIRNSTKLTKEILDCAKNLKIIARAGVGVDNIDVEYAAKKGIWVVNSPDGNTEATAEHTIAMLLALARKIPQAFETLKDGKFERSKFLGTELWGKTLGIAGFGKIGKRVAEIAKILGMEILVYDPFADKALVENFGYRKYDNFDEMLSLCDFLTVHVPKNKETLDLINSENIYKLKKGARIINCARGGIINECALVEAVKNSHIAGAALDVFVDEPEITKCPLYNASENLILVPHLGASTYEAQIKVAKDTAEQVCDVLKGGLPRTPVNKIN